MLFRSAATALNIGIDIPVKKKISIAGEWIFPYWKNRNSNLTFEILTGNLDLKYWCGNRENKAIMSGWFCDVYGGYGKYDIQPFSKNGRQGNFFNVGIGTGYSQNINKNLRLEYSFGLGYIRSNYNKYVMIEDTEYGNIKVVSYPWKKFNQNILGISKLSISLIWIINKKKSI